MKSIDDVFTCIGILSVNVCILLQGMDTQNHVRHANYSYIHMRVTISKSSCLVTVVRKYNRVMVNTTYTISGIRSPICICTVSLGSIWNYIPFSQLQGISFDSSKAVYGKGSFPAFPSRVVQGAYGTIEASTTSHQVFSSTWPSRKKNG